MINFDQPVMSSVSDLGFHFGGHSVPVNNFLGNIPVFWGDTLFFACEK